MNDAPPPDARPNHPWGPMPEGRGGETVRITTPDLRRRAAIEKSRGRLVAVAGVFVLLFLAVAGKLADATLISPLKPAPRVVEHFDSAPVAVPPPPPGRAAIIDANGQILAVSLPVASLYADPRQMIDTDTVAQALKRVLPDINEPEIAKRLASAKAFVYIARTVTPAQQFAINNLGVPGLSFQMSAVRRYPLGDTAAQILGGVDVDGDGVAGVEKFFNTRLNTDTTPLRLSIDVRVQAILRDEVSAAVKQFTAIGGCGIVQDANDGRVLGMVSIPDFDANDLGSADPAARFNRCATGTYEPGSVFKLQTASMALDDNVIHLWDSFNTTHPIPIGRFHITDFEPKHYWMQLPDIMRFSSNIGASRISVLIGKDRQRDWLKKLGLLSREPIELPEAALPQTQPASAWGKATVMTVSFGNGIAETPLHISNTAVAIVNGGTLYPPTLLAAEPGDPPRTGTTVMQPSTSDTMRKLMRLIVVDGTGNFGEVPGYFVGAKTGTAQKVAAHGGYVKHTNYSSYVAAFPIYAPRYVVYIAIDSGHATAETHGFTTGGWMAGPAVSHTIARIGPMLNVMPRFTDVDAINAELAIATHINAPPGVTPLGPDNPGEPDDVAAADKPARKESHLGRAKVADSVPAPSMVASTLRHDAMYRVPLTAAADAAH
ncbi:peptidoglycan D,D-transpeptidase FtsI family protein [Acidisoma cladoniae]|uniref:peptidoglycan D,D-transpeptidase FtsI family protein n=1 Tax=Acidisoma cladoniae TaxID=3040935 RepID=UPI00254CC8EA|nr:penicillin-binding protein 2 [Acidisoma sp. PAMC 29798]